MGEKRAMRSIFRSKAGPVFTTGRLSHFAITAGGTLTTGTFLSLTSDIPFQDTIATAMVAVAIIGFAWELSTPILAKVFRWAHLVDFAAFQLGSALTGMLVSLL